MSEFEELLREGFAEAAEVLGTVPIVTGTGGSAVTRGCILSPVDVQRALRETGFQPKYTATAELSREDATALGLYPMETTGSRKVCTVGGRAFKRDGLDDDPHDPFVRLHLIPDR